MLESILALDREVISFISLHLSDTVTQTVADIFTWLGYAGAVWIVILGVLILKKPGLRLFFFCGLTLLATFLAVEIALKLFIQRPRPFVEMPWITVAAIRLPSFSFPSGHAAAAAAAFFAFARIVRHRAAVALVFTLSILVAVSRVVLKVHYPSDVIAGYFLGILIANALYLSLYPPQRPEDAKKSLD